MLESTLFVFNSCTDAYESNYSYHFWGATREGRPPAVGSSMFALLNSVLAPTLAVCPLWCCCLSGVPAPPTPITYEMGWSG